MNNFIITNYTIIFNSDKEKRDNHSIMYITRISWTSEKCHWITSEQERRRNCTGMEKEGKCYQKEEKNRMEEWVLMEEGMKKEGGRGNPYVLRSFISLSNHSKTTKKWIDKEGKFYMERLTGVNIDSSVRAMLNGAEGRTNRSQDHCNRSTSISNGAWKERNWLRHTTTPSYQFLQWL